MTTVVKKMTLPKFISFVYTGEWRPPKKGEWFLSVHNQPVLSDSDGASNYPIMKVGNGNMQEDEV